MRRTGTALALTAAALYGTNIVSAQIAGAAGLSGPLIVAYRVLAMLILAFGIAMLRRQSLDVPPSERKSLLVFGGSCAIVGMAYLSSVAFVPVTVAAVIFFTFPILIVLAEPLVTKRPLKTSRGLIALAAFCGVAIVIGPDIDRLDPRGIGLAFLASAGATFQFYSAGRMPRTSISAKIVWSHAIILPVTLLVLAITGGFRPPSAFAAAPFAAAVTILTFLFGFLLQVMALARISAASAGIAFCAEPVFAVLSAVAILGERIAPLQYGGAALVILAIITNIMLEWRQPTRPAVP